MFAIPRLEITMSVGCSAEIVWASLALVLIVGDMTHAHDKYESATVYDDVVLLLLSPLNQSTSYTPPSITLATFIPKR